MTKELWTECTGTTLFHPGPYKTLADVEYATAGWVDRCNHRRLHGSLGMVPPAAFEHAHYAAISRRSSPYENGTKAVTLQFEGSSEFSVVRLILPCRSR